MEIHILSTYTTNTLMLSAELKNKDYKPDL